MMIMKMKNGEYYDDNGDNFDDYCDENYHIKKLKMQCFLLVKLHPF